MTGRVLYLVAVEGTQEGSGGPPPLPPSPDVFALSASLYLVRTEQTRSELYHAVKRRLAPRSLLVAPLADAPKFKGFAAGAQKWLRSEA